MLYFTYVISPILLLNVYWEEMFDEMSLFELNKKVKADYNTKVRINPSYFRGTAKKHVERYAHLHKRMLEREINEETIKGIFLNMIDIYFGGFTFGNYTFTNHELFVTPLIYEAIPVTTDDMKVWMSWDGKYHISEIEHVERRLFEQQYMYTKETSECSKCKYLASCVSRNVLSYMESRGITDCFLPKDLFRDASRVIELENRNVR